MIDHAYYHEQAERLSDVRQCLHDALRSGEMVDRDDLRPELVETYDEVMKEVEYSMLNKEKRMKRINLLHNHGRTK